RPDRRIRDRRQRVLGLEPDPALRERLIDALVLAHRHRPLLVASGHRLAPGHPARRGGRARLVTAPGHAPPHVSFPNARADARPSAAASLASERLPTVPISQGTRSVSPRTTRTLSIGTPSSSATTCANAVRIP